MDDGETTGGLHAKPGGTPVTTAAFAELEGDSAMWSNVEMWPTETLQCELAARSWKKRVPAGTRCVGMRRRGLGLIRSGGRRERREAVPQRDLVLGLLDKAMAGGVAVRRCRGGVLVFGKAMADGTVVRWCRGGVLFLVKSVAGGDAVRRCHGGVLVLGKAVAGRSAVRRSRIGVMFLDKAVAGGVTVRQCRGGVLVFGKAVADGTVVRWCRGEVLFLGKAVAGRDVVR